jgi:hypothetical protein
LCNDAFAIKKVARAVAAGAYYDPQFQQNVAARLIYNAKWQPRENEALRETQLISDGKLLLLLLLPHQSERNHFRAINFPFIEHFNGDEKNEEEILCGWIGMCCAVEWR